MGLLEKHPTHHDLLHDHEVVPLGCPQQDLEGRWEGSETEERILVDDYAIDKEKSERRFEMA